MFKRLIRHFILFKYIVLYIVLINFKDFWKLIFTFYKKTKLKLYIKMKKFQFLVLLAFVVSTAAKKVEAEDFEPNLKAIELDLDWRTAWNLVKNSLEKAEEWLKKKGLWEPLLDALKNKLPNMAKLFCDNKGVPGDVCGEIMKFILTYIEKNINGN